MTTDQWNAISRTLDYIMSQPTKIIKESPGSYAVRGEPKKEKKQKKPKVEPQAEQLRLF